MAVTFTLVSCVRGYHIYKNVWIPVVGETVNCEREDRNPQDPYAVGLKKDGTTVGHVPRTISCICTLLLRRGGVIEATVTGPQYSQDLPQGGLELPCTYRFTGEETLAKKARQLLLDEHDGVSELEGM